MKTTRMIVAALCGIAMLAGTSSCKKEKPETEGEHMRIEATIGGADGNSKTHLDGPHVIWDSRDAFQLFSGTNGEAFVIRQEEAGGKAAHFLGTRPGDAPYYGCYPNSNVTCETPGTFKFTISELQPGNPEDAQLASSNAGPMVGYMESAESNLIFHNVMSWLYIGLIGDVTITKVVLTDKNNTPLNGILNVTVNNDNTFTTEMTGGSNTLTIELAEGVELNEDTPEYFRFLVPAGAFNGEGKVEITVYTDAAIQRTFVKTFPGHGVVANNIYTASIGTKIKQPGFSVSSKQKVFISPGNLQYKPSENQWRFAPKQWEICDPNTANHHYDVNAYKVDGTSWIDLFAWGTSGNDHGAIIYQPWQLDGDSNNKYKAYGDIDKDLDDPRESGLADWGVGKTINGRTDWRTLSYAEWTYMLNSRENAAALKSTGNIAGVNGAILLPDDWVLPTGMLFYPGAANYSVNSYSVEQWTIMESAGAIFLPSAGSIDVNTTAGTISNVNNWGWYWATTHFGKTASDGPYPNQFYSASSLVIIPNLVFTDNADDRSDAFSVRLVRNAN